MTEHLLLFSTALPTKYQYQGVDVVTLRRASLQREATRWQPPPRDGRPHLRKAIVYNGRLTGKTFTSALSQEMLSEPLQRTSRRTSKVSSKVYVCISRRSRAPALVDIRRAFVSVLGDSRFTERVARARPWTGVANESSSCASGGTVPRRQETAAQEPRGRSTNTTSESPRRGAARRQNRAKTRTHDDAESHAGPVGGAAQRLGLGNVRSPLQN